MCSASPRSTWSLPLDWRSSGEFAAGLPGVGGDSFLTGLAACVIVVRRFSTIFSLKLCKTRCKTGGACLCVLDYGRDSDTGISIITAVDVHGVMCVGVLDFGVRGSKPHTGVGTGSIDMELILMALVLHATVAHPPHCCCMLYSPAESTVLLASRCDLVTNTQFTQTRNLGCALGAVRSYPGVGGSNGM